MDRGTGMVNDLDIIVTTTTALNVDHIYPHHAGSITFDLERIQSQLPLLVAYYHDFSGGWCR